MLSTKHSDKIAMTPNTALYILAKSPETGKVKTRLGKTIGMEQAKDAHVEMLDAMLNIATDALAHSPLIKSVNLLIEGNKQQPELKKLLTKYNLSPQSQADGDLGDKMAQAFITGLQNHKAVIITGTDCPLITPDYLNQAAEKLQKKDLVLGPAEDGGYVLIGASKFNPTIFAEVSWGGETVYEKTCLNIQTAGLSYEDLPTLWDIDIEEDLIRWKNLKVKL